VLYLNCDLSFYAGLLQCRSGPPNPSLANPCAQQRRKGVFRTSAVISFQTPFLFTRTTCTTHAPPHLAQTRTLHFPLPSLSLPLLNVVKQSSSGRDALHPVPTGCHIAEVIQHLPRAVAEVKHHRYATWKYAALFAMYLANCEIGV
jgi:hypothetical protein